MVHRSGHGSQVASTTTANGGLYEFLEVEPGDYFVAVVLDGTLLGPGGTYSASSAGGDHNPDTTGDHDEPNGDDGVVSSAGYVVSQVFTAAKNGQIVTTDSGDPAGYLGDSAYMTVDFGFTQAPLRIGLRFLSAAQGAGPLSAGWWLLCAGMIVLLVQLDGRRLGAQRIL